MNIPLNGRIAIIDDQINHAQPIFNILSKRQLPFTYFSGEEKYLPEDGENLNDVRILFLDINLIDNSEHEGKILKSRLVPVLKRVISKENYPYIIIYWSRHEHHKGLIKEIFNNDLTDRQPIAYLSANKLDYFSYDGALTEDFEVKIDELFNRVNNLLNGHPTYTHLLNWENQIHLAADSVLQNIFSSYSEPNWENNANYTFCKLGEAYLGKHYKDIGIEGQIKSGFVSLSIVFRDILEHKIQELTIENLSTLNYTKEAVINSINTLNLSLNTADCGLRIEESGNVIEVKNNEEKSNSIFGKLLFSILSFFKVRKYVKTNNPDILQDVLIKEVNKRFKSIRNEIKKEWKKIYLVVTPVCDFAQRKSVYDRVIKGILIPKEYEEFIEDRSEAVFTIPFVIELDDKEYYLVIDFRYFITIKLSDNEKLKPLFRIRQELLSEIQSKLARHINRQGILFVDEK